MEVLMQGVTFMIMGMGVVFAYLLLMVFAMHLLRIVVSEINKIFPEPEEAVQTSVPSDNSQEIAAAIAAAYSMKK